MGVTRAVTAMTTVAHGESDPATRTRVRPQGGSCVWVFDRLGLGAKAESGISS